LTRMPGGERAGVRGRRPTLRGTCPAGVRSHAADAKPDPYESRGNALPGTDIGGSTRETRQTGRPWLPAPHPNPLPAGEREERMPSAMLETGLSQIDES